MGWYSGSGESEDAYRGRPKLALRSDLPSGELAYVVAESAVVVLSGEVALGAVDTSGGQCLKGLFGAGDVLLARPPGLGCVDLVAHSDARVSVHPWRDVAPTGTSPTACGGPRPTSRLGPPCSLVCASTAGSWAC